LLRAILARDKKLKRKHLKIKFFFVPTAREKIFAALIAGQGDLAAANLSITPQRAKLVDFAQPIMTDVRRVVLTGPTSNTSRVST